MLKRFLVVAVLSATTMGIAATPSAASKPNPSATYFSSMAWPVRASRFRTESVRAAIVPWVSGDASALLIVRRCLNLKALQGDPRGEVAKIKAPKPLARSHLRMVRSLASAQWACQTARTSALRALAAAERFRRTRTDQHKHWWHTLKRSAQEDLLELPEVLADALETTLPPREDRDSAAPLFPGASSDRLRTAIARACKAAGVPVFSPHDLRHRRISLLHRQGQSWAEIARFVGQRKLSITADTYTHVMIDGRDLDYAAVLSS